jgi:hydrogenase-1 operon protein HyaE
MTIPLIQALTDRHNVPVVDESSIEALLLPANGESSHVLLFFPGDAAQRPESSDVAVIMPQLLEAFGGRLRGGIVAASAEDALKPRFQVLVTPSLVLTNGKDPVDVFSKVLDWSDYRVRIEQALDGLSSASQTRQ